MISIKRRKKIYISLVVTVFFLVKLAVAHNDFKSVYDSARQNQSSVLAEKAIERAHETGQPALIAKAYYLLGYLHQVDQAYYKSLKSYFSALNFYEQENNTRQITKVLINIGIIYVKGHYYDEALKFYTNAELLSADTKTMNDIKFQIAKIHRYNENYELAIRSFEELIRSNEVSDILIAKSYLELGHISEKYKRDYDSSEKYYVKATQVIDPDDPAYVEIKLAKLHSLGFIHTKLGHNKVAKQYLMEALGLEQLVSPDQLKKACFNLAELYEADKSYDSAIVYYEKGVEYGKIQDFDQDYLEVVSRLMDEYVYEGNRRKYLYYKDIMYEYSTGLTELQDQLYQSSLSYQIRAAHTEKELTSKENERMLVLFREQIAYVIVGLVLSGLAGFVAVDKRLRKNRIKTVFNNLKTPV